MKKLICIAPRRSRWEYFGNSWSASFVLEWNYVLIS